MSGNSKHLSNGNWKYRIIITKMLEVVGVGLQGNMASIINFIFLILNIGVYDMVGITNSVFLILDIGVYDPLTDIYFYRCFDRYITTIY